MQKEEILQQLNKVTADFVNFCNGIDDEIFFSQPTEKWSIAQNISHLEKSAKATKLAYTLPKFIVRLYAGKPNRPSKSYDELEAKYKAKLAAGGRASSPFVPKTILAAEGKQKLLNSFSTSVNKLSKAIQNKWADNQLDQYIAPHPLLGKITLREMGYFTIYHTQHHLNIIKERLKGNI